MTLSSDTIFIDKDIPSACSECDVADDEAEVGHYGPQQLISQDQVPSASPRSASKEYETPSANRIGPGFSKNAAKENIL